MNSERSTSIDALRGFAVVLMIQQHLGVWLTRLGGPRSFVSGPLISLNFLGGFAAPLFVTLAGWGLARLTRTDPTRPDTTSTALVRRGLVLYGFGVLLNCLTPHWFTPSSFYVLHLLGVTLVLGPLVRRLSPSVAIGSAPLVVLLAVLLQWHFRVGAILPNDKLNDTSVPGGALGLALYTGHFPVLPWLAFALVGYAAGTWLAAGRVRAAFTLAAALVACGALARVVGAVGGRSLRGTPFLRVGWFSFYPASFAFVLLLAGAAVLAITLASELGPRLSRSHPLVLLGRTSLTWMIVHIVLFREGSEWLGIFRSFSAGVSLLWIALTLVVCAGLSWLWAKIDFRYSLEWWLRALSGSLRRKNDGLASV